MGGWVIILSKLGEGLVVRRTEPADRPGMWLRVPSPTCLEVLLLLEEGPCWLRSPTTAISPAPLHPSLCPLHKQL